MERPKTHALLDQKVRSLDTIDDFWFNRLHEGDNWPSRVVCSELHAEYLKAATQIGVGRKRGPAEFGARLAKLVPGIRKFGRQSKRSPAYRPCMVLRDAITS